MSIGNAGAMGNARLYSDSTVLEQITIRGSAGTIPNQAFYDVYLTGVYVPAIPSKAHAKLIVEEGVTSIGSEAFRRCGLGEVILPSTLTSIGNYAFYNCSGITRFSLPAAEVTIADSAFSKGATMQVVIPPENTAVQQYFTGKAITVVTDGGEPFALTLMGNGGVFADGSAQYAATLPWCAKLALPDVSHAEDRLFSGWYTDAACTQKLSSDLMPARDLVLYAGWDVDVYTLTLMLNGGTTALPVTSRVFADSRVKLEAPVREGWYFTGWYTDEDCTAGFDGRMPTRDTTLYAGWAASSPNLRWQVTDGEATLTAYERIVNEGTSIYLPDTVDGIPLTAIGPNAFDGQGITSLYIPASIRSVSSEAFIGMADLTSFAVSEYNPSFTAVDGVLFSKDMKTLIRMPEKNKTHYYLPGAVEHIADYAFHHSRIVTLIPHDGLVSIGRSAFEGTALSGFDMPDSLTRVGERAFYDCENLTTLRGTAHLTDIGALAFETTGLLTLYGPTEDCAFKTYAEMYGHLYNHYRLTLVNGGSETWQLIQSGEPLALPEAVMSPENKVFTGWYWDAEATLPVADGDVMPEAHSTVYAGHTDIFAWEAVTDEAGVTTVTLTGYLQSSSNVTIPATLDGKTVTAIAAGCFPAAPAQVRIPETVTLIEDGAFPEGDTLFLCAAGSAAETYAIGCGFPTGRRSYTLHFDANGGASITDAVYAEGSVIDLPVPVRTGYTFLGWHWDAALTQPVLAASAEETAPAEGETATETPEESSPAPVLMPAADSTMYASWAAQEGTGTLSFTYEEFGTDQKAIRITGLAEGVTSLVIPAELHGLPVTEIAEGAFQGEAALRDVSIPGSITRIPAQAFADCTRLAAVTLHSGTVLLDERCFARCRALTQLDLPDTLERIGSEALLETAITTLTLPAGFTLLADDALSGMEALQSIRTATDNPCYESVDGVLYDLVETSLVKYPPARSDASYTVRDGTCMIGANAFLDAHALTAVILPDTVWTLRPGAFAGSGLTRLPDLNAENLTAIPEGCFSGCRSLTEITIPANIQTIGDRAFAACAQLKEATIPATVTAISRTAFSSNGMVIHGEVGTAAEVLANECGFLFLTGDSAAPQSITLDAETLLIYTGETHALTAAILPAEAADSPIIWRSSDPSLLSVDENGLFRGLQEGTVTLTATLLNGLTASCTVDIHIAATHIDLPNEHLIPIEGSCTLAATVLPLNTTDQRLVWASSDPATVSVDDTGLVTGHRYGTAVITATAHNGVSVSTDVCVYKLSLEPQDAVFSTGDTVQMVWTAQADARPLDCTWTVNYPDWATVDATGLVTFLHPGTVTVTMTVSEVKESRQVALYCQPDRWMDLPDALTVIEGSAFRGINAQAVHIPDGTTDIGSLAFADCKALGRIEIPASVVTIAADAFSGSSRVVIAAAEGSTAHTYALEHSIPFVPAE